MVKQDSLCCHLYFKEEENWILYHANSNPGEGCGNQRSPRAQPFGFKEDGTPDFGKPVSTSTPLNIPSHK